MLIEYTIYPNINVRLHLDKHITILAGDSGTGKTLIRTTVPAKDLQGTSILTFTYQEYMKSLLYAIRDNDNSVFILDRFDLYNTSDIITSIIQDTTNYFLIMTREWCKFPYGSYDLKELMFNEQTREFTLQDF